MRKKKTFLATTCASLFEIELEPNLLDWNVNELEYKLELKDMKQQCNNSVITGPPV